MVSLASLSPVNFYSPCAAGITKENFGASTHPAILPHEPKREAVNSALAPLLDATFLRSGKLQISAREFAS